MLGCQLLRSRRFAGARKPDHQEDCGCPISPHPQRRIVRRPASTDSFRLARTRAGATHRHCVGDALRVRTISLHNRPHPQAGREIGVLKGIPHLVKNGLSHQARRLRSAINCLAQPLARGGQPFRVATPLPHVPAPAVMACRNTRYSLELTA